MTIFNAFAFSFLKFVPYDTGPSSVYARFIYLGI